jgi:hypothetical protein
VPSFIPTCSPSSSHIWPQSVCQYSVPPPVIVLPTVCSCTLKVEATWSLSTFVANCWITQHHILYLEGGGNMIPQYICSKLLDYTASHLVPWRWRQHDPSVHL